MSIQFKDLFEFWGNNALKENNEMINQLERSMSTLTPGGIYHDQQFKMLTLRKEISEVIIKHLKP